VTTLDEFSQELSHWPVWHSDHAIFLMDQTTSVESTHLSLPKPKVWESKDSNPKRHCSFNALVPKNLGMSVALDYHGYHSVELTCTLWQSDQTFNLLSEHHAAVFLCWPSCILHIVIAWLFKSRHNRWHCIFALLSNEYQVWWIISPLRLLNVQQQKYPWNPWKEPFFGE